MIFENHTFTAGITGSGKTYWCSEQFALSERLAIFINTNSEKQPETKCDVLVHDVDGVIEAINQFGKQHICYTPSVDREIEPEDLEQIIDLLFKLGLEINKDKKQPLIWCELYIDEIQEYEGKRAKTGSRIRKLWKRGRRYGIIGIGISQRPADVSHTVLTQSRTHVIFQLGVYEKGYFEAYGIPAFEEAIEEHLAKNYHYIIIHDKGEIELHEPV